MKNRRLIILIFNCSMIITAIIAAITLGIVGYGQTNPRLYDLNTFFYPVGKKLLNGFNPYADGFAYPPHSAFIFMLLSVTDLQTSKILFLILNIFCIAVLVYLCIRLYNLYNLSNNIQFFLFDFKSSLLISMIIGNVFIINILWLGQTSLLISTALLASFYFYVRSCEIKSGIFLAVALIKPQLAYTFLLWLLLEKKWKTLAASIVTTVILGIVPIYDRGIITAVLDWINTLPNTIQANYKILFKYMFGLQPLLLDFGIRISTPIVFTCAIILVILIHQFYKGINKFKLFGMLTIIGLLLGHVCQYDLFILVFILPYYLINIQNKDFNKIILLCLTYIIINFPRKLLLLSDYRILHHHREIILIVMLFFLLSREEQPSSGPLQN